MVRIEQAGTENDGTHAGSSHIGTPFAPSRSVQGYGPGRGFRQLLHHLGAEVTIVYRRSEAELPARAEEVEHAEEEGIKFAFLNNPVEVLGEEGWVSAVKCQVMELSEPDASGRRSPVEIPGSEFDIECDAVIMSLGTSPNPLIKSTTEGLETQKWGGIVAEEATGLTSREGVYAGGDAVTGAATVILAMQAGRAGAAGIHKYLSEK